MTTNETKPSFHQDVFGNVLVCRICRKPISKSSDYTYGACDRCTKLAIDRLAARKDASKPTDLRGMTGFGVEG